MQMSLSGWLKKSGTSTGHVTTPAWAVKTPIIARTNDISAATTSPKAQDSPRRSAIEHEGSTPALYSPPARPLDPLLTFTPITPDLIPHFKRINTLLLPIPYPASFYAEITADPLTASISLLAHYDGKPIGGIRCRILSPSTLHQPVEDGEGILYISTICVLSPYRALGVAGELLRRIEAVARDEYGLSRVGAHVWTANTDGRTWYRKRGFKEVQTLEGYYPRLTPRDAIVVIKPIAQ